MTSSDNALAEITRLRIAAADMDHAAGGARHMMAMQTGEAARMNNDAKQALEAGSIVSYARPFTRHGVGALDRDEWAPAEKDARTVHYALLWLRDKRYAHTDETELELRGVEDVFADGHYAHSFREIAEHAWPRIAALAEEQATRFNRRANELEDA